MFISLKVLEVHERNRAVSLLRSLLGFANGSESHACQSTQMFTSQTVAERGLWIPQGILRAHAQRSTSTHLQSPLPAPPNSDTLEITPSAMDLSRSVIIVSWDAASRRGAGDRRFGTCCHLSVSTVASQERLSQLIQSALQTRQRKPQLLAFYFLKGFSHSLFLRVLLQAIFIMFHL